MNSPSLRFYAKWLAQIMLYVTAGHEQAGAVEARGAVAAQRPATMISSWIFGHVVSLKSLEIIEFGRNPAKSEIDTSQRGRFV